MTLVDGALGAGALALLIAPGWFVARRCGQSHPLLGGAIASTLVLFALVLAFDSLGVPLTRAVLGTSWVLATTAAFWFGRGHPRDGANGVVPPARIASRSERWLLLPLLPALAVVAYRAGAQPLFGVDTVFRWNYLAEQMYARETLQFYPPTTASDYEIYGWPDGIAPVVAALYFWIYTVAGATRPGLTAPLIIFQYVLILTATFALGRSLFSTRAGLLAVALLACSPLAAWATAMGQETGLTAVSLAVMLFYLPRERLNESSSAVLFAGLAAGLGALAREYGWVFPLLGLCICLARGLSPGACWRFAAVAALVATPWYVRNWIITGNPLFNLSVFGLFPVNVVHAWLNQSFQSEFGWAQVPLGSLRLILVNTFVAVAGVTAGLIVNWRQSGSLMAAIMVVIAIWAASVSYTAAGFIYSLRVLNPALVAASVLGGAALARGMPAGRYLAGVTVALTLVSCDAALRALTLPANVYRLAPNTWLEYGRALQDYHARPIYAELARVAGHEKILVLGPHAQLTNHGARAVPLWSPNIAFVFNPAHSPDEVAFKLREAQIGFVLLNTGPVNERFLGRSAFFREPGDALRLVWSDADMVLLQVKSLPK